MFIKNENMFKYYLIIISIIFIALFIAVLVTMLYRSLPSIQHFGVSFYTSDKWNPTTHEYGALAFLVGTLITSFLALIISLPFSLMIGIFLGEYYKEGWLSTTLKSMVELLAGIPSIIYGVWGLFVFVPFIRNILLWFIDKGLLDIPPFGIGMFTASVILAVMIIPYSASIGREVISLVPNDLKEAGYSMGATRFEVVKQIILPYCKSGLFAGNLMALGRALGETMAVTMVIGNRNMIPLTIFDPASTLASVIALEFAESTNAIHLSSLVHLGLVLFITTVLINIAGKSVINKSKRG